MILLYLARWGCEPLTGAIGTLCSPSLYIDCQHKEPLNFLSAPNAGFTGFSANFNGLAGQQTDNRVEYQFQPVDNSEKNGWLVNEDLVLSRKSAN